MQGLRRTFLFVVFCSTVMLLDSCSDDKALQHFEDTYASIMRVRDEVRDSAASAQKIDSIMKANGFNRQSFKEAFMDYSRNSDAFRKMMDSVHGRLQRP